MKIHAHFQQKKAGDPTLEWTLARSGVVTASELSNLVTPLAKTKDGEGPKTYLIEKLAEQWIGGPLPSFTAFATEQGTILEEEAIPFAEFNFGLKIRQVGFVSTMAGKVGCSPDGLIGFDEKQFSDTAPTDYRPVGTESGIEIKCPQLVNHIKYLMAGEVPKEYLAQIHGSMFVTGAQSWHFLSYRRGFPALFLRVERDEKWQAAIAEAVEQFLADLDNARARLIKINGGPPSERTRGIVPFPAQKGEYVAGDDLLAGA